jgi:putative hydrolase of the HAD superfamily
MLSTPVSKQNHPITTLFLDLGGVLLTNGWGSGVRKQAAVQFGLDYDAMEERHRLSFNTYEDGKLTLDQYLDQVIFYEPRTFHRDAFRNFMFAQSQPFPEMIALIRDLKALNRLKIVVVSNEGRELTAYRVREFELASFVDSFIVSCFVHYRKPDRDIYSLALDVSQASPNQVIYVDDRPLFIEIARGMNIASIRHTSYETTKKSLAEYGLTMP